jgi:hypothetical protein
LLALTNTKEEMRLNSERNATVSCHLSTASNQAGKRKAGKTKYFLKSVDKLITKIRKEILHEGDRHRVEHPC